MTRSVMRKNEVASFKVKVTLRVQTTGGSTLVITIMNNNGVTGWFSW